MSFTPQQNDALEKAYQILGEHFEGSLIAVVAELDNDENDEGVRVYWSGGYIRGLGLAHESVKQLTETPDKSREPKDGDE